MSPETIEITTRHGKRAVLGYTFGLWAATELDTGWSVTHVPTGCAVAWPQTKEAALTAARRLDAEVSRDGLWVMTDCKALEWIIRHHGDIETMRRIRKECLP